MSVGSKELDPHDRMLVTDKGTNLYRDSSRNAQSSFSNEWSRLHTRIAKAEGKDDTFRALFRLERLEINLAIGLEATRTYVIASAACSLHPAQG